MVAPNWLYFCRVLRYALCPRPGVMKPSLRTCGTRMVVPPRVLTSKLLTCSVVNFNRLLTDFAAGTAPARVAPRAVKETNFMVY